MQRSYTMTELFNTCIDAWGLSLSSKIVSMQLIKQHFNPVDWECTTSAKVDVCIFYINTNYFVHLMHVYVDRIWFLRSIFEVHFVVVS